MRTQFELWIEPIEKKCPQPNTLTAQPKYFQHADQLFQMTQMIEWLEYAYDDIYFLYGQLRSLSGPTNIQTSE